MEHTKEHPMTETRQAMDEAREKQTEALARLNFGPAWQGGDWMSPQFATCNTCGAAVKIEWAPDAAVQPTVKHYVWHDATGTAPR